MASLSALVPPGERALVRARADRLYQDAAELDWFGPLPRSLCRRVCFVVAAIAPALPHGRLSLLARYALWSFRLDDRLDASGSAPEALARVRDSVIRVTTEQRDGDFRRHGDRLLADLARTLQVLSGYDRTGHAAARFAEALRDAVTAEVDQVLWGRAVRGGTRPPPTAERYLDLAARTANYRSFAFALLAVAAGPLSRSALDRLDPALWQAARAVRLSNDLRSVARDRSLSGLNIVDLHTAGGAPVSRPQVAVEIDRAVRAHDEALARRGGAAVAGPALRRSLHVTVGLYRLADLREAPPAVPGLPDDHEQIGGHARRASRSAHDRPVGSGRSGRS